MDVLTYIVIVRHTIYSIAYMSVVQQDNSKGEPRYDPFGGYNPPVKSYMNRSGLQLMCQYYEEYHRNIRIAMCKEAIIEELKRKEAAVVAARQKEEEARKKAEEENEFDNMFKTSLANSKRRRRETRRQARLDKQQKEEDELYAKQLENGVLMPVNKGVAIYRKVVRSLTTHLHNMARRLPNLKQVSLTSTQLLLNCYFMSCIHV